MPRLIEIIRDELCRYFRHLGGRVERAVRSLPPEKVYVKPFGFGNSVGHLVLHLTGNLNHYVGAHIARTGYVRNRPLEFTEPKPPSPQEALDRFKQAVEMVVRTVELQDDASLCQPIQIPDMTPIHTRFGLLLVCVSHLNNHVGQMSYLVQAQGHSTEEPPVW